VFINDDHVYIGSPNDDNSATDNGTLAVFDVTAAGTYAWKRSHVEEALVDNRKITSAFIFDRSKNSIIDYIDYYDPVKGRILGIADREIDYKTEWDPAVYNFGTNDKTVDANTAWGEEHIGEVWWDLSSARWLDLVRAGQSGIQNQSLGTTVSGIHDRCVRVGGIHSVTIRMGARSNTATGLANNISGQPLVTDNTVFTVKQKYDSRLDGFVNYYYYWVKNSVFLPDTAKSVVTRKNTTSLYQQHHCNPFKPV
jgi:hypothetical protein